jgi:two-component system response regulator
VEDDDRLRELLRLAGERSGKFRAVVTFPDGQAALDHVSGALRENRLMDWFILTDLSMPRLDGIELIRALKNHRASKGIPIAVMTSSNRPNDKEDAIDAGCCAFFHKPVNFAGMIEMIASLPVVCRANDEPSEATGT